MKVSILRMAIPRTSLALLEALCGKQAIMHCRLALQNTPTLHCGEYVLNSAVDAHAQIPCASLERPSMTKM